MSQILTFQEFEKEYILESFLIPENPSDLSLFEDLVEQKTAAKPGEKAPVDNRNYNKDVYKNVKHLKSVVIEGTKFVFAQIEEGIKNAAKAGAYEAVKLAKYSGKVLVFSGAVVYVVAREIAMGLISLVSGMLSFAEKGVIKMGQSVAQGSKSVYEWGKSKSGIIKDQATDLGKTIMTILYKVAKKCKDGENVVAALTIAAYKNTLKDFKAIKDYQVKVIYAAAKEASIAVTQIGNNMKQFYNNSVKKVAKAKTAVATAIKKGIVTANDITKRAIKKAETSVNKVKDEVKKSYQSSLSTAKQFADDVTKNVNAVWYALTDSYHAEGDSIFESYVIRGGEKFYI